MTALGVILRAALARFLGWGLRGLNVLMGSRLATWLAGIFAWAGLQFAANEYAVEPLMDQLTSYAQSTASGTGEFAAAGVAWLGFLQFDKALTMVISAYGIAFGIQSARVFLRRA